MKSKKKFWTIIIIAIIVIIALGVVLFMYFNNNNNSSSSNSSSTITSEIEELNQVLDNYYMAAYSEEIFLSQYTYMLKADGTYVTIQDVCDYTGYELPEEYSEENIIIHFTKPKYFLDYPNIKIAEPESDIDLEVLTVYSAIINDDGSVFISSKYDEGGTLTQEEYNEFIVNNSPIHGDIQNPSPTDEEYISIKEAVVNHDASVSDGNVKFLACDEKYAIVVISSSDDDADIKEFMLQKEDGTWQVKMDELESNPKATIFINANYPDLLLDLLPKYNLAEFSIVGDLDNVVEQLKEQEVISEDEVLTYGCGAGRFIYLEFESGNKYLLYNNDQGGFDMYESDNYMLALQKMVELETENPPTFIINFEN